MIPFFVIAAVRVYMSTCVRVILLSLTLSLSLSLSLYVFILQRAFIRYNILTRAISSKFFLNYIVYCKLLFQYLLFFANWLLDTRLYSTHLPGATNKTEESRGRPPTYHWCICVQLQFKWSGAYNSPVYDALVIGF